MARRSGRVRTGVPAVEEVDHFKDVPRCGICRRQWHDEFHCPEVLHGPFGPALRQRNEAEDRRLSMQARYADENSAEISGGGVDPVQVRPSR